MISLDHVLAVLFLMRVCRGRRLQHHPVLMFMIGICLVILLVSACGSPPTPPKPQPMPGSGASVSSIGTSGTLSQQVKIEVPPFHGLEPSLGLVYDSADGNSVAGVGWR